MTTWTKIHAITGISCFLLGATFVSLHLVSYSGSVSLAGVLGVFLQAIGSSLIIGALVRAAGGR